MMEAGLTGHEELRVGVDVDEELDSSSGGKTVDVRKKNLVLRAVSS